MAKFNTTSVTPAKGAGFIQSETVASGTTYEGAPGFAREAKGELFLLAVSNFYGEGSFYENADERDNRFVSLSREVAVKDPDWFSRFVVWLRGDGNIRSASLVAALEGADALREAGVSGGRQIVASVLQRADEPGEALAYWIANHGRRIPQPVKRGIADAVVATYNEYSLAKYDSKARGFRFGDVIDLVHPTPRGGAQSALFKYALDRRRDAKVEVPAELSRLQARTDFLSLSKAELRSLVDSGEAQARISEAGLTWEALSGAIEGGMDAKAWEAVIPSMGYMALLRNLRNFEQASVSKPVLKSVANRLSDPAEVEKSRQLPMRFLSAYRATQNSLVFGHALEEALDASLKNVPSLSGRTLILVDRSGSMFYSYSQKSELNYADTAAVFGTALAIRAKDATLVQFGSTSEEVRFGKSDSVLPSLAKFKSLGGTDTAQALRDHLNGHDRVIILTDEQTWGGYYGQNPTSVVPSNVPVYTWNLAGYKYGHSADTKNRYTFGGLTDAAFRTVELIERGVDGDWPF